MNRFPIAVSEFFRYSNAQISVCLVVGHGSKLPIYFLPFQFLQEVLKSSHDQGISARHCALFDEMLAPLNQIGRQGQFILLAFWFAAMVVNVSDVRRG